MSCILGTSTVVSGLVLELNATNRRSALEAAGSQRSLISAEAWTAGSTAVTGFSLNESVAGENLRLVDTDPWGNQAMVWQSVPSGDGNADGGYNGAYQAIDRTKLYRHSVWVRRTSSTTSGNYYLGLHTNGTGDTFHLSDGSSQTNPYWTASNIGNLVQNQWNLLIGHVFPCGYAGTTPHPESGHWSAQGVKLAANDSSILNDVRFPNDATQMLQRAYHYYCGDTTSRLQFAYPRIDMRDGNEPTLQELLSKGSNVFRDTSGEHTTTIGTITAGKGGGGRIPIYDAATKSFLFDGSTSYFDCGNPVSLQISGAITMSAWVYPVSVASSGNIVAKNYNSAFRFRINPDNSIWYYVSGNALNVGSAPLNVWSHITVTGDASGMKIYVNGNLAGSNALAFAPTTPSAGSLLIGTIDGTSEFFNGKIAQVSIYNRALSAAEVKQNFNASRFHFGL